MAETGSGSDDDSIQLMSIDPIHEGDTYLQRVSAAGSFANYARRHLDTLTLMLTPRRGPSSPLRLVPPEVLRKIVAFAFHVGYY